MYLEQQGHAGTGHTEHAPYMACTQTTVCAVMPGRCWRICGAMCAAQEQYLSKEDQSKERGPLQKWYSHQVQLLLLLAPPKQHRSKLKGCTP